MNNYYYKTFRDDELLRFVALNDDQARGFLQETIDTEELKEFWKEKKGGGLIDLMHR